jgi:protein phosphatase
MIVSVPTPALILLIGPAGAGQSTFARRHFRPTEVLSSDHCRALITDNENDQSATDDAFELLHYIAAKRLARRRLTVIDATNVRPRARRPLLALARDAGVPAVALVFDLPLQLCEARDQGRADRTIGAFAIGRQLAQLHNSLPGLEREGFAEVVLLRTPEEVAALTIARMRLTPPPAAS